MPRRLMPSVSAGGTGSRQAGRRVWWGMAGHEKGTGVGLCGWREKRGAGHRAGRQAGRQGRGALLVGGNMLATVRDWQLGGCGLI